MPFLGKRTAERKAPLRWAAINLALFALIVLGGIAYVVVTTAVATQSFTVTTLEERAEQLRTEHAALSREATHLQSLSRLEASAAALELTAVAPIEYGAGDRRVAAR